MGTLGSGAFSTVVRARDRQTGEEVAVKLIKRGSLVRGLGVQGRCNRRREHLPARGDLTFML